jgi:hypothetical protein
LYGVYFLGLENV